MKTSMIALAVVVLASSSANAFSEYFELSTQRVIRQKSLSAYNTLPGEDTRRKPPAGTLKPYTAGEKSLFQRLLRWE